MITAKDLPVGGTTGLSHEHSAAIDQAVEWLATTPFRDRPKPLVPALRERFGLSALEACGAISTSQKMPLFQSVTPPVPRETEATDR
jgi:hypothetical protein